MGIASYKTVVKMTGTATSMTGQAMSTNSTVANTYQINSTSRRVWDRDTTLTFKGNGSTIPSSSVTDVDYLFGKVTFSSPQATPITVDGNYLPLSTVAGAHSYTLNLARDLLDDTDFSSTGWRSRTPGLADANVAITRFDGIETDFITLINSGSPAVVEVRPGGGSNVSARGFYLVESENRSGDVAALEGSDLSFQLDGDTNEAFRFGTP